MRWRTLIIGIYRAFFLKKRFHMFNKFVFTLGLIGQGILNYETDQMSGEDYFLRHLLADRNQLNKFTIIDVGAHIGSYSNKIKSLSPNAEIYAFEPHPVTYRRLQGEASKYGYMAFNLGCSDRAGSLKLYDYKDNLEGSQHASLYKDVIEKSYGSASSEWDVNVVTLDSFLKDNKVFHVDLLKIDTEGNELSVLMGCRKMIEDKMIDIVHFEFNEMNVVSRVFFRDFYNLLPNYKFYRMVPDGYLPLDMYNSLFCEIYAYQNILAIRQGCNLLGHISD
jgi:FkbM family methyltransferase